MNRIDLIVDRLEHCKGLTQIDRMHLKKALTAARELQELKPVAWVYINEDGECDRIKYGSEGCDDPAVQPLYALEVMK